MFDSPPSQELPESIFSSPIRDQTFNESFGSPVFDSSIQQIVISDLMGGIELALHDKQVLAVRNVVEMYETRMSEFGVTESRDYKSELLINTFRMCVWNNLVLTNPKELPQKYGGFDTPSC